MDEKDESTGPRPMTVQTRYRLIHVNVTALLPLDDPLSVPLAVFMEATNDLRSHLHRSIIARYRWITAATQMERVRAAGELSYAYRAMCGHLYETGVVFERLHREVGPRVEEVLQDNEEAKQALADVRKIYLDWSKKGFFIKVLETTRNRRAFHYDTGRTRQALEKHQGQGLSGRLLVSDAAGNSRYILTDEFANLMLDAPAEGKVSPETIELFDRLRHALTLGRNVCEVVDAILDALMKLRIVGTPEGREVELAPLDDEVTEAEKKIDEWRAQQTPKSTEPA